MGQAPPGQAGKMLVIGLTGGIGTGKSQVSTILKKLGAALIDADLLGHEAYLPHTRTWREIVDTFGEGILKPGGEVDRKKLGAVAFGDPAALELLNAIMHPRMYQMIEERLSDLGDEEHEAAVVEAALLIEANWQPLADEVWVTTTPGDEVVRRLKLQRGLDEEGITARIRSQMPQSERITYADVVIDNSGSSTELERRVGQLWKSRVLAH